MHGSEAEQYMVTLLLRVTLLWPWPGGYLFGANIPFITTGYP